MDVEKETAAEGHLRGGSRGDSSPQSKLECAICLQKCIHPAKLPCGHIFCYLCVKGIANQSKKCAMCRQEIPADFTDKPELLSESGSETDEVSENNYQWFYEGRNGWWQYDERTSAELEAASAKQEPRCEVLIAGFLYIVDFEHMVQVRRNDLSRRRRVKRDLATIPKKGIAGIRLDEPLQEEVENRRASGTTCDRSAVPRQPLAPAEGGTPLETSPSEAVETSFESQTWSGNTSSEAYRDSMSEEDGASDRDTDPVDLTSLSLYSEDGTEESVAIGAECEVSSSEQAVAGGGGGALQALLHHRRYYEDGL
uniref:E3 ubiquitin-protein ligase n=1 Tax=Ixodes ricinus TaxID=34613 RepID=A0A147BGJ2_IXORI